MDVCPIAGQSGRVRCGDSSWLGAAFYCSTQSLMFSARHVVHAVCNGAGFPSGESRANPMYWDEDTRRTWASFVSGSKSMLVRQDAWWDVADVEQRDRRVENVDWNS